MTPEEQTARIEELKDTLLQCLPFFEDWREDAKDGDTRSVDFMIRLIKQSLGESST